MSRVFFVKSSFLLGKTSTFLKIGNFKKSVTLAIPEFKQSSVVCFQLVCPIYKSRLQEFIFSDKNADFSLIDGPLKTTQIIYLTRVSRILGFLLINLKIGFWIIREYSLLRSIIGSFKIKPSCRASEIEKLELFRNINISKKSWLIITQIIQMLIFVQVQIIWILWDRG